MKLKSWHCGPETGRLEVEGCKKPAGPAQRELSREIVLLISILLVPLELETMFMFLTGAVMLVIGMGFSCLVRRYP